LSATSKLLVAVALLLVAAPAHAEEMKVVGALGKRNAARARLQVGSLRSEVIQDQLGYRDYKTQSTVYLMRAEGAIFVAPTRLGTPVGLEGAIVGGWMGKDDHLPEMAEGLPPPEAPAWYGLYLDMEAGMVAGLVDWSWLHVQARAGAALDVDAATLYGGGRLWVGGESFSLELTGDVRYGRSFSDDQVRELRIDALLQFGTWGVGVMHAQGFSEDEGNLTSTRRLFKGSYSMTLAQLVWSMDD
jgi:hypothetical protein